MLPLDRTSAVPLAEQIELRLRQFIAEGRLPSGARLASIRQFAAQLAVSPNTVVTAYDRLMADGLVSSRGTAGYFVCDTAPGTQADDGPLEAGDEQDPIWLAQQSNEQRPGLLLASAGAVPASWLEDAVPATLVQRALGKNAAGLTARCPPQGLPELRERLAALMRGVGLTVDANRVLTTSGGTQAIDLICRAFVKPGDTVVVEEPSFFLLFARLREAGARIVPVQRRPDGLDLAQFEAACIEHHPRLLFMQSVLHNPTGWGSSAANLHRVLVLAERHGVLIAEDDVHGHFQPAAASRLAQLANLAGVVYYSSFCKALSPALRMGYLAAEPPLLKALLRQKICSVLTTPALNERILLELLSTGRWRKHVERLQQRLAAARVLATRRLLQAGILLEPGADDGLFLWGRLPEGMDIDLLVKDAYRNDIVLARGAAFSADPAAADPHIRFNVVTSQQPRLADYLASRLAAVTQAQGTLARMAAD